MTAKTPEIPKRVDAIDWHQWKPKDRATLMFVIQNGRALLIRKKRGLGAGGEPPGAQRGLNSHGAISERKPQVRVIPAGTTHGLPRKLTKGTRGRLLRNSHAVSASPVKPMYTRVMAAEIQFE